MWVQLADRSVLAANAGRLVDSHRQYLTQTQTKSEAHTVIAGYNDSNQQNPCKAGVSAIQKGAGELHTHTHRPHMCLHVHMARTSTQTWNVYQQQHNAARVTIMQH